MPSLETAEAVEWQCRSTRLVDCGVIVAPVFRFSAVASALHSALQPERFREPLVNPRVTFV
jgi:hypothetical protein